MDNCLDIFFVNINAGMMAGSVLEFKFRSFLLEFLGKYQFSLNSLKTTSVYLAKYYGWPGRGGAAAGKNEN